MNKRILSLISGYFLNTVKWVFISTIGISILNLFTHGRAFGLLLYLSIMALSVALAFAIPVAIAFVIAALYEKIDPDPERSFWIGNTIRGLGLFEGCRNVHRELHNHEHSYGGHRFNKY